MGGSPIVKPITKVIKKVTKPVVETIKPTSSAPERRPEVQKKSDVVYKTAPKDKKISKTKMAKSTKKIKRTSRGELEGGFETAENVAVRNRRKILLGGRDSLA